MRMNLRLSLGLSVLLLAFQATAQTPFPTLSGETADGASVELPAANAKGWTVIGIAYGKQAGPILEEWYEPIYLRFVAQHGLMAGAYKANAYFVPLFVGMNKSAYEPSMKKFRKSADPAIVDHVVFTKDNAEALIDQLDMKDKGTPYFFVLDKDGRIVHRSQGAFSDAKLEAMEEVMLR